MKKIRSKWTIVFLFITICAIVYFSLKDYWSRPTEVYTEIAVISIVEIEPIRQLREGFKKTIENSNYAKNNNIKFKEYNAQGDETLITQIVDQITTEKPDLVYVLGTPISQAIQKRDTSIIIVQGAVTDPVASGLADSWQSSGRNYTANSDLPPVNMQVELIKELIPKCKNLGVLYNTGESNSVAIVNRLKEILKQDSISFVGRPVSNSNELASVTESFIGNVDAIYIPPDNTVHSGMKVVAKIALDNNIPLFATTSETIEMGALAALSLDFFVLGEEAGEIALDVLANKKHPKEIPISFSENPQIIINKKVADTLTISLDGVDKFSNLVIKD